MWSRSTVLLAWTGDARTCKVGTISDKFQSMVMTRLNWYRGMMGYPDIELKEELDYQSQSNALVQAVNPGLDHYVTTSYKCYTKEAEECSAPSVLASGITGVDAVSGLINNPGGRNVRVGNRMFMPSPDLSGTTVGAMHGIKDILAMNVIDYIYKGVSLPRRDGFVAWPPPGYVPYPALPTMSFYPYNNNYNFTTCTVTVEGPDGPLTSTIIQKTPGDFGAFLVWENQVPKPAADDGDSTYVVTISGIKGRNGKVVPASHTYTVIILNITIPNAPTFNPTKAPFYKPSTHLSFTPSRLPTKNPVPLSPPSPTSFSSPTFLPTTSPSHSPTKKPVPISPPSPSPISSPTLLPTTSPSHLSTKNPVPVSRPVPALISSPLSTPIGKPSPTLTPIVNSPSLNPIPLVDEPLRQPTTAVISVVKFSQVGNIILLF